MRFTLAHPNSIDGELLAREIEQATGVQLSPLDLVFYPPDQVEIPDRIATLHRETIQAAVTAHAPGESERSKTRKHVRDTAQGAVGIHGDNLNRKQLDDLLRCLLLKSGALDDTGAIRPLDEWL